MKVNFNGFAIRRLGGYRYLVESRQGVLAEISVCRCTARSQFYQIRNPADGSTSQEYPSVKKAAEAAIALFSK
jgi:hypothetical protein